MTRFYPVSLVLFIGLCAAGIAMAGGRIDVFLSWPALVIVVAISFVLSLAGFSLPQIAAAFRTAYAESATDDQLASADAYFTALGRYLIGSGLVGTLIGAITLLSNLRDPATMGAGTALALATLLYGLMLWLALALPFQAAIRRRIRPPTDQG